MVSLGYLEVFLAVVCFTYFWILGHNDGNSPLWNWPVFGMLPGMLLQIHRIHEWCAQILDPTKATFYFKGPWFANMDMVGTVDPANVHYIMSANFSNFPKGPEFMKIFDVLGDGIFNADSDLWRNQRKLARMLINHHRFNRFLVKTSRDKVANGLVPVLEHASKQGLTVDLQDLLQRLTFDTTCTFVTGYDPGCLSLDLPHVPFSKALDDAEEVILIRHVVPEFIWKLEKWLGIGQEKKLMKAWETLDNVITNYISMKREELSRRVTKSKEDEEGVDLLTSYINEDREDMGLNRDDKFLRDTILNFMIAGRDTTSSALTWFFWVVSKNPSVESKIREELNSTIPKNEAEKWRLFDAEETNKLVYLHAALSEALRLYPPVPFQHKEPLEADILPSGHKVLPGMKILFSLYAMGRAKSIWGDDCLEFKPERWITDRGTIKHEPSYKFLSFNAGPRTCIGKEVAFTQMKVVAATVIHNYHVQVLKGHPVSPNVSIILYMKHGLKVKVTKRWS